MTPLGNDWIEWKGGECPVGRNVMIELWLRGEEQPQGIPRVGRVLRWQHGLQDDNDIIAYRVVKP